MRLKKNFYTLSLSGFTPGFSFLKGLVRVATMLSTSSSEKSPLISPLESKSLIYTMNFSSIIWPSVNSHRHPSFLSAAFL